MATNNPLTRKLRWRDTLSEEERNALDMMTTRVREFVRGEDMARDGEIASTSSLVLEGFAARYKVLRNGRRQILAIHVAGDFVDLHSFVLKRMDHDVTALCDCRVAIVPHEILKRVSEEHPHLTRLLWLSTMIDAAIHREWIISIGRRTSIEQLAHLVCEIAIRLQTVDLSDGMTFVLPLTQSDLADSLGLSLVHVNRIVRKLREGGFVQWRGFDVEILDKPRLTKLAGFDPGYLHFENTPR
jgi:CRP-like cAMP-binding protein